MLVFMGYRNCHAIIAQYVAKWGIAQMCLCEAKGVSYYYDVGGVPTFLKSVSRDMGYRSDSIAMLRDLGPLSMCRKSE